MIKAWKFIDFTRIVKFMIFKAWAFNPTILLSLWFLTRVLWTEQYCWVYGLSLITPYSQFSLLLLIWSWKLWYCFIYDNEFIFIFNILFNLSLTLNFIILTEQWFLMNIHESQSKLNRLLGLGQTENSRRNTIVDDGLEKRRKTRFFRNIGA